MKYSHVECGPGQAAARTISRSPKAIGGRLSGVRLGDRVLLVQTEYVDHPLYQVVTIVFVGGKALSQQSVTVPLGTATEVLAHTVNAQHRAVEQQVRAKVATLAHQLGERLGPRPRSHCHQTEPPPIG